MLCRFCKEELKDVFIDLVNSPPSNSFLTRQQLNEPEVFFPLKVYTCNNCFLVQVDEYKKSDAIFDDEYVYFSSFSSSWLAHAKKYTEKMIDRFGFSDKSQVIEIASNDGYLLQYFKQKNIPVLGIEPTANTAKVAQEKGIESITEFFGTRLAKKLVDQGRKADLLLGNNVLAHVPDIVDFIAGMKLILKEGGIITMEFPHLMQLVDNNQFDTIYHEHYSYLSFTTVQKVFAAHGLEMFDVEEQPTHGGSLRIFAKNAADKSKEISPNVAKMLKMEADAGMLTDAYYKNFQQRVNAIRNAFWKFLIDSQEKGKKVIGYGAAAKGNTLMNYAGVKGDDLISFVVDAAPSKQNKFLPGTHIPVYDQSKIREFKPDYVIIFPWNLKEEVMNQLSYINEWGGQFVTFIPKLQIAKASLEKVA